MVEWNEKDLLAGISLFRTRKKAWRNGKLKNKPFEGDIPGKETHITRDSTYNPEAITEINKKVEVESGKYALFLNCSSCPRTFIITYLDENTNNDALRKDVNFSSALIVTFLAFLTHSKMHVAEHRLLLPNIWTALQPDI